MSEENDYEKLRELSRIPQEYFGKEDTWLIELPDDETRIVTTTQLFEMEKTAEEFDGFYGWRVVKKIEPMKQITIQTAKAQILIVDLPEICNNDADVVSGEHREYLKYHSSDFRGMPNYTFYGLPEGSWQLYGKASELTEEQWRTIVESDYFDGIGTMYANYEIERIFTFGKTKHRATESGSSLLSANGVNDWSNPYVLVSFDTAASRKP